MATRSSLGQDPPTCHDPTHRDVAGLTIAGTADPATRPPLGRRRRPGRGAHRPPAEGAKSHTVTLITGDVVTVNNTGSGRNQRRAGGRRHRRVQTQQVGDDLYVVPDAALPTWRRAARPDLFDVTSLSSGLRRRDASPRCR